MIYSIEIYVFVSEDPSVRARQYIFLKKGYLFDNFDSVYPLLGTT